MEGLAMRLVHILCSTVATLLLASLAGGCDYDDAVAPRPNLVIGEDLYRNPIPMGNTFSCSTCSCALGACGRRDPPGRTRPWGRYTASVLQEWAAHPNAGRRKLVSYGVDEPRRALDGGQPIVDCAARVPRCAGHQRPRRGACGRQSDRGPTDRLGDACERRSGGGKAAL
jgi:hypothetical protein